VTRDHALAKLIAFYLPQYHPIPENDAWWGKGFTEWTNVTRARPLFPGHYQPHLPADLGFYDLRLSEVREAQAELARQYGIHGFCYYHYWFNGRRLLERPFQEVLASGRPDFPFCLCWANENWTRAWDGQEKEVLLAQHYSAQDDVDHIRSLIPAFLDRRYIRLDGKPLFLVYRANRMPDPQATTDRWRTEASRHGIGDLFLCSVESFPDELEVPPRRGFDASVEFQPRWFDLLHHAEAQRPWDLMRRLGLVKRATGRHHVIDYEACVNAAMRQPIPAYLRFPCVCPSWDNSARRSKGAFILENSRPDLYERWLRHAVRQATTCPGNLVFLNAWNEWAEGTHLEPCQRWGRQYLEATQACVRPSEAGTPKEGHTHILPTQTNVNV
jgi:hypothetical protein